MRHKSDFERGSALGLVLIFMTAMILLGVAGLIAAENNMKQTVAINQYEKQYYSAEAAEQLAMQMIVERFVDSESEVEKIYKDVAMSGDDLENKLKTDTKKSMDEIYASVAAIIPKELNGMAVTLDLENPVWEIETDSVSYEVPRKSGTEYVKDGAGNFIYDHCSTAWITAFDFTISAISGTRSVTAQAGATTGITVTVTVAPGNDIPAASFGYGASYPGGTGSLYQSVDRYDEYVEELNAQLEIYNTINHEVILADAGTPSTTGNENTLPLDTRYHKHSGGTLILGSYGTTTEYPNLEYIDCNSLEVRGTVIALKLKGIVSKSAVVFGASGQDTIFRAAPEGCNIYSSMGNSTIYANCEINWCRLYVLDLIIEYGSGGKKLTSNSVFVAKNTLMIRGTASSDVSGIIPQYYIGNYINIPYNIGTLAGMFLSSSSQWVMGAGIDPNTKIVGLIVGNCNSWSNTSAPVNVSETVNEQQNPRGFGEEELALIMDSRWLDGGEGGGTISTPDIPIVSIDDDPANLTYGGLKMRETTGYGADK